MTHHRNPTAQELDLTTERSESNYSSDDDLEVQDVVPPSLSIVPDSYHDYHPFTVPTIPATMRASSTQSTERKIDKMKTSRVDGLMLLVRKPHKSVFINQPVTNSIIRQAFGEPSRFSHIERDDGRIIKIETKPDYQYSLDRGHSYRLVPHLPGAAIVTWFRRLYDASMGKLINLTAGDVLLVVIFAIAQVLAIQFQHRLLMSLHAAFPQPPKSPYFEYRQPRWKWECSQRVEFIVHFVAQQPTAFLAILLFARRRLRLDVTRAILLVGAHTFILHGIVLFLAFDVLEHKVDMDWMHFILNWYKTVIYFAGVAALGLRR